MVPAGDKKSDASTNASTGNAPQNVDAHAEVDRLATTLRQAVLQLTWRQWRALGAGAAARTPGGEPRRLHSVVDPEALVLISLLLVNEERRLADLLPDWTIRNSDLLSVQRVKNLEADYPEPTRPVIARRLRWFATVACNEGKDLRWQSLAAEKPDADSDHNEEILPRSQALRGHGAPPKKVRAARVRASNAATLLLRLRLGIGVGVKADVLTYLLAQVQDWSSIRDVTDATGYTIAAVRRAAKDLAAAQFIQSLEGQTGAYRAMHDAWRPLLALEQRPRWGSWRERFAFTAAFLDWAEEVRDRPLSWYAFGAHGRQLLDRHRAAFERDLVATWSVHSSIDDWGTFVGRAVGELTSWVSAMG